MMNEQPQLPTRLSVAVMTVFITMVLGVCALAVFLYNLPVIFPPPEGNRFVANMPTLAPTVPLSSTTPTSQPSPSVTWTGTPSPTLAASSSKTPTVAIATATAFAPATDTATPTAPVATATPLPTATLTPLNGRILLVAEQSGSSIYIMNADGSGLRLLVPHKGDYRDDAPAVSPSGRRVAFSSNRDRSDTDNIYLMKMTGSGLEQLTWSRKARNVSPSWFPDGQHLAFTSNRNGHWSVYTMNDDGSNVQKMIGGDQDLTGVAVSPDGDTLAYTCGDEICLADSDGSNRRTLLKNGLPKDHLAWSPDSTQLAFTQHSSDADGMNVYVVDRQGNSHPLVEKGGLAAWSPAGTWLVYSTETDAGANLYAYNPATGQARRLTTQAAVDNLVWIP